MLNTDDPLHCPHCGAAVPNDPDDVDPGSFRVLHLLHHVRREALDLKGYGQGDPYMADHCAVDWATTWNLAADELRVCIAGPIGDELEAMCRITVELMRLGKLGPRPADWSDERAALSWTKNRMHRWLDDRYPPASSASIDNGQG